MISQGDAIIYDFSQKSNYDSWHIVNDGVMGGLSKGQLLSSDGGNAIFQGFTTTENSGGFSSVKHSFSKRNVAKYKTVVLRVKGDMKSYQFRIKAGLDQQYSYIQEFDTSGEWETIRIQFDSFYPSYRGKTLDMPNYSGEYMEEVTFLIGNKKKESFALEIERIWME